MTNLYGEAGNLSTNYLQTIYKFGLLDLGHRDQNLRIRVPKALDQQIATVPMRTMRDYGLLVGINRIICVSILQSNVAGYSLGIQMIARGSPEDDLVL